MSFHESLHKCVSTVHAEVCGKVSLNKEFDVAGGWVGEEGRTYKRRLLTHGFKTF